MQKNTKWLMVAGAVLAFAAAVSGKHSLTPAAPSAGAPVSVRPSTGRDSGKMPAPVPHSPIQSRTEAADDSGSLNAAIAARAQKVQVKGEGRVVKVLRDAEGASLHQKFLLKIPSGTTLLFAHNIDLAPRLEGLQVGDTVAFAGEYVWTPQGGVVHWTHKDPRRKHPDGYLQYNGRIYQ